MNAGLYVHIPFCRRKCHYCDFSSYPGLDDLFPPYVRALQIELASRAECWRHDTFDTIYIGGGTPTLLKSEDIAQLLEACHQQLKIGDAPEITIEANPGTVSLAALSCLGLNGVNRISLGVQSFDDAELILMGRIHSAQDAVEALGWARQAGFGNINLDLIFGLPRQTMKHWQASLDQAIALAPEHLSLYALTLEPHTVMCAQVESGSLPEPEDELVAEMYEWAEYALDASGYQHYEISNWARRTPGKDSLDLPYLASRHNLVYWHNGPYLGLGAAAYSYDGQRRFTNEADPRGYIQRILAGQPLAVEGEAVDRQREIEDTLMLGLRLLTGVSWQNLVQRFGVDIRQMYAGQIEDLVAKGLLIVDAQGMRLSRRGHLLGNQVFGAFI